MLNGGVCLVAVAHRLRTVIDYDRLIVLDKGEVSESSIDIFFMWLTRTLSDRRIRHTTKSYF